MKTKLLLILVLLAAMLMAVPAFAYIDPGTGSFLVQGIIATVVGAGITIKLFWQKIKAALGRPSAPPEDDDDDDDDE